MGMGETSDADRPLVVPLGPKFDFLSAARLFGRADQAPTADKFTKVDGTLLADLVELPAE